MAPANVARIIRAPGRVIVGPTDLTATDAGGTVVGKTSAFVLQPLGTGFRVMSEALGEATDILEAGNEYAAAFFIRAWDDDAVEQFLGGGYAAGSKSGHAVWSAPGTQTPGQTALGRGKVIIYLPDDVLHVPAVIVYNGIPDWSESSEIAFQRSEELGLPITLDCIRDGSGRIASVGIVSDLNL